MAGTEVIVQGGTVKEVREAGGAEGTCVEAKQIFSMFRHGASFACKDDGIGPCRASGAFACSCCSGSAFHFCQRWRTVFDLPGTRDWRVRIAGLAGAEAAGKLIEVPHRSGSGMKVRGYLLPAEYARKGRRQQFVFLNGRPIEDPAISRALRDGFRGAIAEGTHPAAWMWVDMDPALVDVNVHPLNERCGFIGLMRSEI